MSTYSKKNRSYPDVEAQFQFRLFVLESSAADWSATSRQETRDLQSTPDYCWRRKENWNRLCCSTRSEAKTREAARKITSSVKECFLFIMDETPMFFVSNMHSFAAVSSSLLLSFLHTTRCHCGVCLRSSGSFYGTIKKNLLKLRKASSAYLGYITGNALCVVQTP